MGGVVHVDMSIVNSLTISRYLFEGGEGASQNGPEDSKESDQSAYQHHRKS